MLDKQGIFRMMVGNGLMRGNVLSYSLDEANKVLQHGKGYGWDGTVRDLNEWAKANKDHADYITDKLATKCKNSLNIAESRLIGKVILGSLLVTGRLDRYDYVFLPEDYRSREGKAMIDSWVSRDSRFEVIILGRLT